MGNGPAEVGSLKRRLLESRSAKLRLAAQRFLQDNGGTDVVFERHKVRPSSKQFQDICVAAKFGPGDPLFAAGRAFALDYLLGDLNQALEYLVDEKSEEIGYPATRVFDHGGDFVGTTSSDPDAAFNARLWQFSTPHVWGNVLVQCVVSSVLIGHIDRLAPEDLVWDDDRRIYVDIESRTIGVRVFVSAFQPIAEMPLDPSSHLGRNPSQLKSNDQFSVYTVQLGVADAFDAVMEADLHDVQSHDRQLASGKVVPVRPHQRHNPMRGMSRKLNFAEVRHVVYKAYDKEGQLRYVGEGTEGRPHHVNSGTSHNYKLNEHFFTRGEMRIEIVATGLSKSESLALEYLLIKRNAGQELWNVRENTRDEAGCDGPR